MKIAENLFNYFKTSARFKVVVPSSFTKHGIPRRSVPTILSICKKIQATIFI